MANFQTLTQINDLIQKLEILKAEKEDLRKAQKNTKLSAATELWKFEQAIRAVSSQKQKSIAHKQGLLLFKEAEEDLSAKLKAIYKPQIEAFLPKILDFLIDKIIEKNKLKLPESPSSEEKSSGTQNNSLFVADVQIVGTTSLISSLPTSLAKRALKSKLVNTPDYLQIILPSRIYLLQPEILVNTLVDKIITKKLATIAQIKLLHEVNSSLPEDEAEKNPENVSLEEAKFDDESIEKLLEGEQIEPLNFQAPNEIPEKNHEKNNLADITVADIAEIETESKTLNE